MTDQDLLTELQYSLVELPDGGASWPSGLWTRDEVLAVCNQRQDRLLLDSLLVVVLGEVQLVAGQRRFNLPANWIRTVGMVWHGNDGTIRDLPRADTFETDHAIPNWESVTGPYPLVYTENDTPLLQAQIAPAPLVDGHLRILYIPSGADLTGNGATLVVPDEASHAVKYGGLADLLSKDGRGKDPIRASYCEQRFQLAIEVTRIIIKGWP